MKAMEILKHCLKQCISLVVSKKICPLSNQAWFVHVLAIMVTNSDPFYFERNGNINSRHVSS